MIYEGYYIEELVHVWNVYANYDAWRLMEPILHTASSLDEAKQWVDQYLRHDVIADTEDVKSIVEAIEEMPFMPEKGPPLPEYVAAELYPSPTWDLMKAPVSEYGRAVVEETARLLKEFMRGGNFELRDKFEETGWSSEDIIYTGELLYTATGVVYLTEIYVSFAWRDPTKDVARNITLFEEKPEGSEDIWDGDLSYEGGQAADSALRG